jgi:hypothetical protein
MLPFFCGDGQISRVIILQPNRINWMNHETIRMNRRQAIGLAACICGGSRQCSADGPGLADISSGSRGSKSNLARQLREVHLQLLLFNQEIVPRFIDNRDAAPAYESKRADRFLKLSLFLRRKLDKRSVHAHVEFDATWLRKRLQELHVRSRLDFSRFDDELIRYPGMTYLRNESGQPGHAFASLAWGITPDRLTEHAQEICKWMNSPAKRLEAIEGIGNASLHQLKDAFLAMDRGDYLELVETLFMIRPETPVSFLTLRSQPSDGHIGFRSIMSHICGNLMERLTNNYFHQTLAIGQLAECKGSWHSFIAGQVFDILMQKWLRLMVGVRSDEPIEMEQAGDLSSAMKRGIVEGMLHASSKSVNLPKHS